MGTSILTNGLMTIVAEANPSTNFDYQTSSMIRRTAGGSPGEVRWLLYFPRPFPLKATITSAKIVMTSAATAQTGTLSLTTKRLKAAVSFTKITWTSRPTTYYTGTATSSRTGPVTAGSVWETDVTAMMQSVSLGDPWYGFEISSANLVPGLFFYGPTYSDPNLRPRLEVTWSDAPSKPTGLAPAGGRAISGTKPIVRCNYVDVSGEVEMQSIQVQANATNVWSAPTFDSGTVASSTPELDLSTTTFPAMTDGQVIYWRVRVQDMAGLWSDWSDGDSFARDVKGTLTLTNPPSGTPIVEETTPPISWTFTGETQTSYQLTIQETTTTGHVRQWTTGKKTAATTTVTLPTGVINSPDSAYQATLRVWDSKQRETLPGDPAYTEIVRSFTYTPSATVTATTSPTAATVYPYPRVSVGWSRATAPDSFTILRNRQVIASNLVPATYLVSGTTYSYTDTGASPQTSLTYEVQAIVNGKASASNPTVTTTLNSAGIWLADSDRSNEVLIIGRDDRNVTYGEDSEPITVVGASEIVLVTQSLRGMEGTITGELQGGVLGLSFTAQQWRDALLRIKAKAGRKCWLTLGDRTVQCVVRNIAIKPKTSGKLAFTVSFDFYQTGTLEYTASL